MGFGTLGEALYEDVHCMAARVLAGRFLRDGTQRGFIVQALDNGTAPGVGCRTDREARIHAAC